jgi:hypothetical protein
MTRMTQPPIDYNERAAATTDTRPVIDSLDLLVLHNAEP